MSKGYWIAHITVSDAEIYERATNSMAFDNGRFLVRSGQHDRGAERIPLTGWRDQTTSQNQ